MKDLKDGSLIATITIPGCPRTKKNSNRLIRTGGRTRILPSKIFMDYQKHCEPYIKSINPATPIDFGVMIKLRIATETWRIPDMCNVQQAIGDILQHHGFITDDKWIFWTCGATINGIPNEHFIIGKDKDNPRLEMEIRRFRHPLEDYYANKK